MTGKSTAVRFVLSHHATCHEPRHTTMPHGNAFRIMPRVTLHTTRHARRTTPPGLTTPRHQDMAEYFDESNEPRYMLYIHTLKHADGRGALLWWQWQRGVGGGTRGGSGGRGGCSSGGGGSRGGSGGHRVAAEAAAVVVVAVAAVEAAAVAVAAVAVAANPGPLTLPQPHSPCRSSLPLAHSRACCALCPEQCSTRSRSSCTCRKPPPAPSSRLTLTLS